MNEVLGSSIGRARERGHSLQCSNIFEKHLKHSGDVRVIVTFRLVFTFYIKKKTETSLKK